MHVLLSSIEDKKNIEKKVVLISPDFFDLSKKIKTLIEEEGYEVFYFSDRPSEKMLSKALIRLNRNFLRLSVKKYVKRIVNEINKIQPDKIIIINGQSFKTDDIKAIINSAKDADNAFFAWDSVSTFPFIKDFFPLFKRSYTFDDVDAKEYGVNFLPNFYYGNADIENIETKYDYSFISTIKKGKYSYIKKLREQLDTVFQRSYCFLYLQSKLVFFYNKLTNREFKKAKIKEFSFKKISSSKVREISLQSKYIIDATMSNQNGLPFRVFEALHMKKKLITNNENIKKYPFYTPDNILIYKDGDKIELSSSFFTTPFNEEYSVDDTYSGKSFIRKLLNIGEKI